MSRLLRIFFAATALVALLPGRAEAQCSDGATNLSCNQTINTNVGWEFFGTIGGLFGSDSYPGCGVGGDYDKNEKVFVHACASDGPIVVTMTPSACNLDVFAFDAACDPSSSASCLAQNTRGGRSPEVLTFNCVRGQLRYFVVERRDAEATLNPFGDCFAGFGGSGDCCAFADHDFRIELECVEVCDDGFDNDLDGYEDCLDEDDCPPCFEDCDDGVDNDYDGLVDCLDPDCARQNYCCDIDGDGYWSEQGICGGDDCNDNPVTNGNFINPGAFETPADGVDSNCDGFEDCYQDADRDFYGIPNIVQSDVLSCLDPFDPVNPVSPNDQDCDDNSALRNPGVPETPVNGIDENCDGEEDCYLDNDRDGYGVAVIDGNTALNCIAPGVSPNADDCDDAQATVNPGATELPVTGRDEDCDGFEICFEDLDGDSYGTPNTVTTVNVNCIGGNVSGSDDDCNDTPGTGASIFPGATERVADGIDQNCDGLEECYVDADSDDFGNDNGNVQLTLDFTCLTGPVAPVATDCDDTNPAVFPGAPDQGGDIDWDCDGAQRCYQDNDGDGYGSNLVILSTAPNCAAQGIAPRSGDCDDNRAAINPDATEQANNGTDEDCDGFELCPSDVDNDNFGTATFVASFPLDCTGAGAADNTLDCDDSNPSVNPLAVETPVNNRDDNCDGLERCYLDSDNDRFGRTTFTDSPSVLCDAAGASPVNTDCNDGPNGALIYPGAPEIPVDGIDQNCDTLEDCYIDNDRDGYGNSAGNLMSTPGLQCNALGFSRTRNDCDDDDALVYPGAPTPVNPVPGTDYSCSGTVSCYVDADLDGFGGPIAVALGDPTCTTPGYAANSSDCDDNNAAIKPTATEIPNNQFDENCDGLETCFQDVDGDGFGTINLQGSPDLNCNSLGVSRFSTDCNDNPAQAGSTIYPGAPELPASGLDENCDGLERCYLDNDNDSYGSATATPVPSADLTCLGFSVTGQNVTDNNLDCDDALFTRNPGATERPANGVDEDCDLVDSCYQDADGDLYGNPNVIVPSTSLTCNGAGFAANGQDCYDVPGGGELVNPGATEIPGSGVDENCDGRELCFADSDRDGYGGTTTLLDTNTDCIGTVGSIQLSGTSDDCRDNDAAVNPGATEVPADGFDQDCDGFEQCYQDEDRDTWGTDLLVPGNLACNQPGFAVRNGDCLDRGPDAGRINPGVAEILGDGVDQNCDGLEGCYVDADLDGFGTTTIASSASTDCSAPGFSLTNDDCDDRPNLGAVINPDADEIPFDNIDQDCDGLEACWMDEDGDGFGRSQTVATADFTCTTAPGVADNDDDCNDFLLAGGNFVYPGATEITGNGVDENCDGLEECFADADGDSYGGTGTVTTPALNCVAPNASRRGGDCNDGEPAVNPGATETPANNRDDNCDGNEACYQDRDGDDWGTDVLVASPDFTCSAVGVATRNGDCLDVGSQIGVRAVDVFPTAPEICNNVDDNCDGLIDDQDPAVTSTFEWYPDSDGDFYGRTADAIMACSAPPGFVSDRNDCDDTNPAINPGADEVCDPLDVDEDCDGLADEADIGPNGTPGAVGAFAVRPDVDNDGYGDANPATAIFVCDTTPGFVLDATDCDDGTSLANPGRDEVPYNGLDDDCDTATRDDDLDNDGALVAVDCNDLDPRVRPGATEVPNGIDDDCDGLVDEGTNRFDADGDGFTPAGGDCNDGDPQIRPGAPERPNGLDDDCDGTIDEGTDRFDNDNDGFTPGEGDCNDADAAVNPGQTEIMDNGIDDDCDGNVDDGVYDPDGDGYTADGGDCDETDPEVRPGAPERPNGVDDDCDGIIDEGTENYDDDGDGFSEVGGDCNDSDPDANPGATEVQNGRDDDCDEDIDEGTANFDDDGDGFAEVDGDCDDANPEIFPTADEVTNGIDDNCNDEVDENSEDLDEDGYTVAGGDCDDEDGWRNPGLPELCDGVDNNCVNGTDDEDNCGGLTQTPPDTCDPAVDGCCGCNSPSRQGGVPWVIALVVAVALRRRRAA